MGRNDRYVPVAEKRLESRFWPENLEDILDIGPRFLTVTPPFDEELLDYICNIYRPFLTLAGRKEDHAPSAKLRLSLSSRTSRFRRPLALEVFTGLSRENPSGGTSFTHPSLWGEAMIKLN